jgi:IMP cyclohydrolase (EC 3.5.4.10)/phosphoribosylaminoimidazolecarboxamide formyltransferase (EC 2.1.2.3)
MDFKRVNGGCLLQERDIFSLDEQKLKVVTRKKPGRAQMKSLFFAWEIAKHVKSNAIVLAKGTRCVGIGAGQMSRVESVAIAAKKAGRKAGGLCLASDAFFPKPDSITLASRAGVKAIIQPGGSIADEEIIRACDKYGIAMVFTGIRHFKH